MRRPSGSSLLKPLAAGIRGIVGKHHHVQALSWGPSFTLSAPPCPHFVDKKLALGEAGGQVVADAQTPP